MFLNDIVNSFVRKKVYFLLLTSQKSIKISFAVSSMKHELYKQFLYAFDLSRKCSIKKLTHTKGRWGTPPEIKQHFLAQLKSALSL